MAASRDECIAQFPRQPCCIDRTYSRSLAWGAYVTAQPLPPTDTAPEAGWVRQRIVAEQMPLNGMAYAQQIAPFLLETPNVTSNIHDHLNAWNNEGTETALAADIDSALAVAMPKYANATVTDQQVADWCGKNGYPAP